MPEESETRRMSTDADLLRENAELRAKLAQVQEDYGALVEIYQEQEANTSKLQEQLSQVMPIAEQAANLEQQLFQMQGQSAFKDIAEELKIAPAFRDDVFKLADFKYEGPPDAAALKAHVAKFLEGKPHYLGTNEGSKQTQPASPLRLPRDTTAGRGPDQAKNDGRLQVTKSQLRDALWTEQNAKALATNNFEIVG